MEIAISASVDDSISISNNSVVNCRKQDFQIILIILRLRVTNHGASFFVSEIL
jgi:hypothetical protein